MFFVRTAQEGDLTAVSALLAETFHATYDALYGVDKVNALDAAWNGVAALKALMARPHSEFLVADDGRRIGGMAYAAMDAAGVVTLAKLYVRPGLQGQGIGRDLFAEIESCFPEGRRLRLEVEPANAGALAFYAAHGLETVGRTENCGAGGSGIPALILEKSLQPQPF